MSNGGKLLISLQTIFCGTSFIAYFLVMVALIFPAKEDNLRSSFFRLSLSLGITDLLSALNNKLGITFRMYGWFFDFYAIFDPFLARIANFGSWFFGLAQIFELLLIGINRYTAMAYPLQWKPMWTRDRVHLAITLKWLGSFLITSPMLIYANGVYVRDNGTNIVHYDYFYPEKLPVFYGIVGMLTTCTCIVLVISYGISFYKAKKRNTAVNTCKSTNKRDKKNFKTELKLVITGFVLSCELMVICAILVAYALNPDFQEYFVYYTVAHDVFTLSNPYVLIVGSSSVRKRILELYVNVKSPSTTGS